MFGNFLCVGKFTFFFFLILWSHVLGAAAVEESMAVAVEKSAAVAAAMAVSVAVAVAITGGCDCCLLK